MEWDSEFGGDSAKWTASIENVPGVTPISRALLATFQVTDGNLRRLGTISKPNPQYKQGAPMLLLLEDQVGHDSIALCSCSTAASTLAQACSIAKVQCCGSGAPPTRLRVLFQLALAGARDSSGKARQRRWHRGRGEAQLLRKPPSPVVVSAFSDAHKPSFHSATCVKMTAFWSLAHAGRVAAGGEGITSKVGKEQGGRKEGGVAEGTHRSRVEAHCSAGVVEAHHTVQS